jgi:hypothetical protein
MTKRTLFVLAALVLAGAGVYARQLSADKAHSLASQVVSEDVSDASVTATLDSLKSFVVSHMGASTSITLSGSYNRADATSLAATQAAAKAEAANAQIYANAQQYCSSKANSIVQADCNAAYLQQHLVATPAPAAVAAPKLSDYKIALMSPVWTPDLAGALFLGAVAAFVLSFFVSHRKPA